MTGDADNIVQFIDRWGTAGGGERSNYQMFQTELCVLLDVAKPNPAVEIESRNAHVFERKVPARRFAQGKRAERKVDDVLRTLTLLGQAERANGGYILSA